MVKIIYYIIDYCGAKGSGCPGPFQILSLKAQVEEENVRG